MRILPRVPPALLALWSIYALAAALGYAAAFREPKRTAITRSAPRTSENAPRASAVSRESALAEPAQWSQLAPAPELAPSYLPPGAPAFSAREAALGARLFLEPWTAGARTCASCHVPEWGFGDGAGAVPPLLDLAARAAYRSAEGWSTLEARVARAILSEHELFAAPNAADRALASFAESSAANESSEEIGGPARALAVFLALQRSGPSAFDRARAGASPELSELQQRGRQYFEGASGCARCHPAPEFPVVGGSTLRDLELRPPYASPRWRTLREVLSQHETSAPRAPEELAALEAFLRSLGSERSFPFLPERAPALSTPR
ncbi:MAG: hypothetical protein JNM84_01660 [Planctomycetes bacterium]|nr:hypothetical protein [Planctomycetota bacterium]